jgi:hypothetical protein
MHGLQAAVASLPLAAPYDMRAAILIHLCNLAWLECMMVSMAGKPLSLWL